MIKSVHKLICILFLYLIVPSAYAGLIELVSVSSSGAQGDDRSFLPSISADGRFVVIESYASNLVVGDTNGTPDIFVHDRDTGIIERVSVSSNGAQSDGHSFEPSISADGRFVVFESFSTNLVTGDTNGYIDIFVHDRDTGITERVSVSSLGIQGNYHSSVPSISADGRFVAFGSLATNLVDGDTNGDPDIFVHDRDTGITERVSVSSSGTQANWASSYASISVDGRFVVFASTSTNLVLGDTNGDSDIFVHDRDTGITERVSVSSSGAQANWVSSNASISADGRFVVFASPSTNLVLGDTNGKSDIFVHDRDTGITERVNVSSTGEQVISVITVQGDPTISTDGRFVVFESYATNLVPDDTNNSSDIFVHDRDTGITERVNVSSSGAQGNSTATSNSISADGRFVVFDSLASNLVANDTNNTRDIFVTENTLIKISDKLIATLRPTTGTTPVGEYIRYRARIKNNSDTTVTNCNVQIVNPAIGYHRLTNFYTWPLKVSNPVLNGAIDIAPGETGEINIAVMPRVAMRREISFKYICDTARAFTIPFINTLHLTGKTEPLIAEDYVYLKNNNSRTALAIDRSNGKYWAVYVTKVINAGSETASVNLTTTSEFPAAILRQSLLCEPINPGNGNWSCISPQDTQVQVELDAGETKNIIVFVHANQPIDEKPVANRIYVEAHDGAGEIVAKTSMGISTIN